MKEKLEEEKTKFKSENYLKGEPTIKRCFYFKKLLSLKDIKCQKAMSELSSFKKWKETDEK